MHTEYFTAYQISGDPDVARLAHAVKIGFSAVAGIASVIITVLFWVARKTKRLFDPKARRWFIAFLCLFVVSAVAVPGSVLIRVHELVVQEVEANNNAIHAFAMGSYQSVEGQVSRLTPTPYGGHTFECFFVQDKRFCYSDTFIMPGFRVTSSHGGPIRAGMRVQIAYRNFTRNPVGHNTILKLKIAKE